MKKTPSKVAHNRPPILFFSKANRPKTTPNLNLIKNYSPHDLCIMTLGSIWALDSHGPFLTDNNGLDEKANVLQAL